MNKTILAVLCMLVGIMFGNARHLQAGEHSPQASGAKSPISLTIGFDLESVEKVDVSSKDIQAAWDVLCKGVAEEYGIIPQNVVYNDLSKLIADFTAHKLDIVLTTALNYLRMPPEVVANRSPDVYGAVVGEEKVYHYLLLVRADSGISEIGQLQEKTLVVKRGDTNGLLYLDTLLGRSGQDGLSRFFRVIQENETFSQVALSVFFKKGEVCLVTQAVFETMTELNPQVGKQLAILDRSPAFANPVLFFQQQLPQDTKDLIITTLLNLETTTYGKQLLTLHRIDRLARFEPSDLDSLRTLLQEHEQRKRQTTP